MLLRGIIADGVCVCVRYGKFNPVVQLLVASIGGEVDPNTKQLKPLIIEKGQSTVDVTISAEVVRHQGAGGVAAH